MTEKLYWSDPHRASFETGHAVLGLHGDRPAVVLPETLFYPEGGGQLGDAGTLEIGGTQLTVADTQIDDDGTIHHVLEAVPGGFVLDRDARVTGTIDAARRRDHMVQHTAQHALSRALADTAGAETVSARLGVATCTIDVARPSLRDAELHRAEDLVAAVVGSDVEVRALYPDRAALAKLPLRKQPKVESGVIRIIEIDGFDLTPCGGTHCTRTGQIGQARIVGLEKYKGMLRITFHAGLRALADARQKHAALAAVSADLTCGILDVPAAVSKLRADLKGARAILDAAKTELAELVASATLAGLPPPTASPKPLVVPILRPSDDIAALRLLAGKLAVDPRVIALAGAIDPASGELIVVLQRGANTSFDSGAFVKAQAQTHAGKGGGRPERAEARFPRGTSLEALAAAASLALG